METRSVADVVGPWAEPNFKSSLIERCRSNWLVPIGAVSNYVLATFIRQRVALALVLPEADRRIASGFTDDSELYDEELANAVADAKAEG